MSEVKWTHERILEELRRHSWASQAMGAMRDDMQATIDALRAASRITDAKLTGDLEMARDRIRELEQQLATLQADLDALDEDVWEPVSEQFLLTHDTGLLDHPKLFVRWNADDESVLVGKDDGSFYHCPLPPDIRLCRKRPPAQG